jgi:hypothetical protein
MAMGVVTYSRGHQTVYSIRWSILFKRFWHSWCRCWEFPIGISKFLAGKPTSEGNQARHRQDRDMRVGEYQRACQTVYSIRWALFVKGFLDVWGRGWEVSPHKFRNFWVWGDYMDKRWQAQTSYGYGGCFIFKRTSNYIFYQVEDVIQKDLGYLVQGFGNFPQEFRNF